MYAQHAVDQQKYNLPFAPACGYCFSDEALSWYDEPADDRLNLLEYGPQYYLDGTPIENPDKPGEQLVLTALQSKAAAEKLVRQMITNLPPVGSDLYVRAFFKDKRIRRNSSRTAAYFEYF